MSSTIYHGTSSEKAAQAILKSKTLNPRIEDFTQEQNFTPLNRTYFTTDLPYAMIYALGGDMFGGSSPIPDFMTKNGEYGYVFVGDNSKIKNHYADEDTVGEIVQDILDGNSDNYNFTSFELGEIEELVGDAFDTDIEADDGDDEEFMTPFERFMDGEVEFFAAVGKYILRYGSARLKVRFRQNSKHHSHDGNISVLSAYRFKKEDANTIKRDGSNFLQHATKIL